MILLLISICHKRGYCSSPGWYMSMGRHSWMISTGENSWFVNQSSLESLPTESSSSEAGVTWRRKCWILPTKYLFHTCRVLLTCRKSTKWEWRLYFPSEGSSATDFCRPWKSRHSRPGLNPRTFGPVASTLLLDHQGRDYFIKQYWKVHLCNGEVWCFLWVTTSVLLNSSVGFKGLVS
jgi:hypothetical protein